MGPWKFNSQVHANNKLSKLWRQELSRISSQPENTKVLIVIIALSLMSTNRSYARCNISSFFDELGPQTCSHFRINLKVCTLRTDGGISPVARPLPTQDNTNTEETQTYIHASNSIQTHDPSVPAGKDFSWLRPHDCYERLTTQSVIYNSLQDQFGYSRYFVWQADEKEPRTSYL
jgi:hypothetical protein